MNRVLARVIQSMFELVCGLGVGRGVCQQNHQLVIKSIVTKIAQHPTKDLMHRYFRKCECSKSMEDVRNGGLDCVVLGGVLIG